MTKIKNLFKTLLCACMLLGGMVLNPMNANAAKEETVTPYAQPVSMVIPADTFIKVPVQKEGYALNYVLLYVTGSYVYNRSTSGNYVSNVNLTFRIVNSATSTNSDPNSTAGNGIYQVVSFTPQTYSAGPNLSIVINYKLNLRLLSGANLGLAYNTYTLRNAVLG